MHYLNRLEGVKRRDKLVRIFKARTSGSGDTERYNVEANYAKILLKTRKPCSCSACSRKRKYDGETIQEKRITFEVTKG